MPGLKPSAFWSALWITSTASLLSCADENGDPNVPREEVTATDSEAERESRDRSKKNDRKGDADDESILPEGRWRPVRPRQPDESDAIQAEIEALEAIGYAAGTLPARDQSGITIHDSEHAFPGRNLVVSGHAPEAVLMEMDGTILHRWRCDFATAFPRRDPDGKDRGEMWRRAHVFPDGDLLAIFEGFGLVRLDRDSTRRWGRINRAHHDLDVAPDGTLYVLTREARVLPRLNEHVPILEDFVTVMDAEGKTLRTVSLIECFENSEYPEVLEESRDAGKDIFHTNTLEYLHGDRGDPEVFQHGRVLISLRHRDLIAVADLDQQSIVWCRTGTWRAQHQPVLLDSGNILLFDNNAPRRRISEVLEFKPMTGEVVWSYREDEPDRFFSKSCGSCQRLDNGNTLITESDYGRAFEVTPDREIVWEYHTPFRAGSQGELVATLFEVVRLAPDFGDDWL